MTNTVPTEPPPAPGRGLTAWLIRLWKACLDLQRRVKALEDA